MFFNYSWLVGAQKGYDYHNKVTLCMNISSLHHETVCIQEKSDTAKYTSSRELLGNLQI